MTKLTNPVPLFLDARGALLDAGKIYVGAVGADPRVSPLDVFWDQGLSVPALQPLGTLGGVIVNGGSRSFVFMAEADYSLRIEDADGNLVDYVPSASSAGPSYQPLDSDLTAIASLSTTAFGRNLLTLANAAALRQAAAIPDSLPAVGGTVSGAIVRQGAGVHLYHYNSDYASGRVFGPEYTTDPTTQPGDIWFKPDD